MLFVFAMMCCCCCLHVRYNGEQSTEVALTHHLLARMHAFLMDFRTAISHEKIAFPIYDRKVRFGWNLSSVW